MPNMKRKKKKGNDVEGMDENPYPYGLAISLDEEVMDKLGIDLTDVGAEIKFTATSKVVSISEYDSEGSDKSKNMSLQITDMYIDKNSDEDVAKRFYKKDKGKANHNSHNSHYESDK